MMITSVDLHMVIETPIKIICPKAHWLTWQIVLAGSTFFN